MSKNNAWIISFTLRSFPKCINSKSKIPKKLKKH